MDHRPRALSSLPAIPLPQHQLFCPPGGPSQEFLSMTPIIHNLYRCHQLQHKFQSPSPIRFPLSNFPSPAVPPSLPPRWGGSPLSTQWEKTGQIQSVPPWFIFEQNRPEGKVSVTVYIVHVHIHNTCIHTHVHVCYFWTFPQRLQLTEAINRSLLPKPQGTCIYCTYTVCERWGEE